MVNHTLKSVSFTPSNASPSPSPFPFPPPPHLNWNSISSGFPWQFTSTHLYSWVERERHYEHKVSCLRTQHISPIWSQSQTFLPRVQRTDHCVFHILSNKTEQSHNFGLKPHFEYHWAQHLFLPCFLQILGSSCQVLSSDPGSLAQEWCVS